MQSQPAYDWGEIDDEVQRLMDDRRLAEEERERLSQTTLAELKRKGSAYAFNEVTGEIVWLECERHRRLLDGDVGSPEVLCQLLFDQEGVDRSWSEISFRDVYALIMRD